MRIGFLLNHEAPHQVPHAAPTACELSRRFPSVEVVIFVGTQATRRMLARVLALYPDHRCRVVPLRQPLHVRWAIAAMAPASHKAKKHRLAFNRAHFSELDALVTPEKTSLRLRQDPALAHLALIHTRHGAGDRAVGFDARAGEFDLVLAAGRKIRDRLVAGGVAPDRCRVVGYPKFDVAPRLARPRRPFPGERPVVLYNPHYADHESSWRGMGRAVLDFFRSSRDYNLIFAPHVKLYHRRFRYGARLLWRERLAPNILVDTGSDACHDMSHALAADLYLGDVSSQVYEFLWRPRPCLFLDAHDLAGREPPENLRHWAAGEVLSDPAGLPAALARALARPAAYRQAQEALMAETFDTAPDLSAGARAADAIMDFMQAEGRVAARPPRPAGRRRAADSHGATG